MLVHLQTVQPDYIDLSTNFTALSVVPLQKWREQASRHPAHTSLSTVIYCLCLLLFTAVCWLMSLPCWSACFSPVVLPL